MSKIRLPSFLCIGTQKSGTSWLFENLRYHPGIWMPPLKELHYFDHLYCKNNRSWSRWHVKQGVSRLLKQHVQNNEDNIDFVYVRYLLSIVTEPMFSEVWYEQIFQRPTAKGKIIGDITPEYCAVGNEGIRYVKQLLGEVNIIWLVRDPICRALSQVRMNAERRGFSAEATIEQWMEIADSEEVLSRGDYRAYMPKWERAFGRDKVLYLPFKQIASQPGYVLQRVESFVGAEHWSGYPAPDKKVHATQNFSVPDQVTTFFEERFQTQYQFLNDHFDAEFVNGL